LRDAALAPGPTAQFVESCALGLAKLVDAVVGQDRRR
jgi:hypothetical protein